MSEAPQSPPRRAALGRGSTLERLNTRLSSVKANLENLKSRRLRIENPMLLIKLPIIQHDSLLKNYWDALMFVVIFYNCNMTPLLIATQPLKPRVMKQLRTVDFFIDLLFMLDTLSGFMFAFVDEDTKEVVTSQKAISDAYTSGARLKLNLLAISPLFTSPNKLSNLGNGGICKALYASDGLKHTRIARKSCIKVARLTRTSRIFLFFGQLDAVRAVLARGGILVLTEASFRMIQIIVSITFLCSFGGSFYFFLACNENSPKVSPYCVYGNMTKPYGRQMENGTAHDAYRRSKYVAPETWVQTDVVFQSGAHAWHEVVSRIMYFMVQTLFTIGYGDSVAPVSLNEIKFAVVLLLVGAFTYASVIANMTSVIANANVLHTRHQTEIGAIARLMDDRDMPDGLKARIKLCFEYMWSKQYGILDENLLAEMPAKLRALVCKHQSDLVLRIPFFASANRNGRSEFAMAVAARLTPRIFVPNSTVVYAHEKQREMFMVRVGTLLVFSRASPAPLATLEEGDHFGEFQLVLDVKHPVCVRCDTSFVELLVLTHQPFAECCEQFGVVVLEQDAGVVAMTRAYSALLEEYRAKVPSSEMHLLAEDSFRRSTLSPLGALSEDDEATKTVLKEVEAASLEANTVVDSYANVVVSDGRVLICPFSRFHAVWEPALFALTTFMCVMVPIRAMLYVTAWRTQCHSPSSSFDPTLVLEYCVDAIFLVDMYLRAFHFAYEGIVNGQEQLITDTDQILKFYVRSFRFKVDLVGNVPYAALAPLLISLTSSNRAHEMGLRLGCKWYAVLRFPHLVRCVNLHAYLMDIKAHLEVTRGAVLSESTITIIMLLIQTMFLIMLMASLWSVVHSHGSGGEGQSFQSAFARSVYFAIVTFTTVGYGDITPETVSETWFMIVSAVVGATFFAGIVANLTSFVHSVDVSEDNIGHQRTVMEAFLDEREVSCACRKTVLGYFDHMELEKNGVDEFKLLDKYLPQNMRDDVVLYLAHRVILSSKVFRGCEHGFLRAVMLSLEQRFYMRDDEVASQSKPVDGMSFVHSGAVSILVDGESVHELVSNASFAEEAVLGEHPVDEFSYTAKCTSYSEQWYLRRTSFRRMLNEFPLVEARLEQMAKRVRAYVGKGGGERKFAKRPSDELVAVTTSTILRGMILHPHGAFMRGWCFLLLFFTVWNVVLVPFKIAFLADYRIERSILLLSLVDYFGDCVFALDVLIRCRHLAFEEGDQLVVERHKIFNRYKDKGGLLLHFFCSLPLDVFFFVGIQGPTRHLSSAQFLACFRVNKILRFADVVGVFKECEASLTQAGVKLHKNGVRLARLVISILLASHFFGSLFFAIANSRGSALSCRQYAKASADAFCLNWAQGHDLLNVKFYEQVLFENVLGSLISPEADDEPFAAWGTKRAKRDVPYSLRENTLMWKQYFASVYWGAATISTVGYGDISASSLAETIFSIISVLCAVAIYTTIIANMEDIVAQMDVTSTLYHAKREKVKQYCLQKYLPEDLQQSINDYYDKLWAQQKGVSGTQLLTMLPRNVRATLVLELCGAMLHKVIWVKNQRPGVVEDLALVLTLDLYMPKDFLFRAGECAWQLFFVFFGSAQLLDEVSAQVYSSVLGQGALGEAEFLSRVLYPVSGQATDYSQIFVLHWDQFRNVLRENELLDDFREHIVAHAAELEVASLNKIKETVTVNSSSKQHGKITKTFALSSLSTAAASTSAKHNYIDPSSIEKRVWLMLCFAGLLYFLISVPFEIAFARHYKRRVFVLDACFMALYVLDIYLNLTRFMVKKQGKLISDPEQFRQIYLQTYLFSDILGLAPLSFLAVLCSPSSFSNTFHKQHYVPLFNVLRLSQVLRVKQVSFYFRSFLSFLEDYAKFNAQGDLVYLFILLISIAMICHWLGCIFYFLGRYELYRVQDDSKWLRDEKFGCDRYAELGRGNVWICEGGYPQERAADRWLMAYYWAMYTCSTVGYGAISIKSNAEKCVCIVAMLAGCVLSDAGTTAVLTAYIGHKDNQAGSNKRRSDACSRMMTAANVDPEVTSRVNDFFHYVDGDLANLDEQAILDELNVALHNDLLHRTAHTKLIDSIMYGGFEAGIVATMVYQMRPVVAVPAQAILKIGQVDPSLYVFQSGLAHSEDSCGDREFVTVGAVLSNVEFKQVAKRVGVPIKSLTMQIISARNLPPQCNHLRRFGGASVCSPYVEVVVVSKTVFGASTKTFQTRVRKFSVEPHYGESFTMKAYQNTDLATVTAFHWRRGIAGLPLGSVQIAVKERVNARARWHTLKNERGAPVGAVRVRCDFQALERPGIALTAELTVVADSFCHLYLLSYESQEIVKEYIKGMRLPLDKRLDQSTHKSAKAYRPSEDALKDMTRGDDEISLCTHSTNNQGFEAYMSEAFSKRSSKGSVMHVANNDTGAPRARPSSEKEQRTSLNHHRRRSSIREYQVAPTQVTPNQVAPTPPQVKTDTEPSL